jgi:uncharacterized protein (TIGR00730 family)
MVELRLCVFCGSALGTRPEFAEAARIVGQEIGRRGWTLVYGGGRVGLMGVLADAATRAGARVTGVIPRFLYEREVGHDGLTSLEIVESFAVRKERMGQLSDAFLALPGGVGTMDELFEAWSWTLAGLQVKPSGLLNTAGYYDDLVRFLDRSVLDGLLKQAGRRLLEVSADPVSLLDVLRERSVAARG